MNWWKALMGFFDLFKEGKELANAATWKNRTIATNAVVAFLGTVLVIAKATGHEVALDQETVANLGAGIVAAVGAFNAVMHTITSARVGLQSDGTGNPPAQQPDDAGQSPTG